MPLLSYADFSSFLYSNNSFRNTIRVSNGLDPDQDRRSVGPDLGTNYFHVAALSFQSYPIDV